MRPRSIARLLLAAAALALSASAWGQATDRPGAPVVRVNPPQSLEPGPAQPDKAYRPQERDKAMGDKPASGCSCEGNNRCYHSLDFNYCVAKDGHRVYLQRYWD